MAERRGGNLAPVSQTIKKAVRSAYMDGRNPVEIEKETGISANTIYAWIRREGWKDERMALKLQNEADGQVIRSKQTNHIIHQGYEILMDLVDSYKKTPPTLDEGLKLLKLMEGTNKIYRINEGRPTEMKGEHRIVENRDVSSESEVRDVINADPFTELEDDETQAD